MLFSFNIFLSLFSFAFETRLWCNKSCMWLYLEVHPSSSTHSKLHKDLWFNEGSSGYAAVRKWLMISACIALLFKCRVITLLGVRTEPKISQHCTIAKRVYHPGTRTLNLFVFAVPYKEAFLFSYCALSKFCLAT